MLNHLDNLFNNNNNNNKPDTFTHIHLTSSSAHKTLLRSILYVA